MRSSALELGPPPKSSHLFAFIESSRLLVIEDDFQIIPLIGRAAQLVDPHVVVDWAVGAEEARWALRESRYDAILADYLLPGSDSGLQIAADCRRLQPRSRLAMMSSHAINVPERCHGLLRKPFGIQGCRIFLERLLRVRA